MAKGDVLIAFREGCKWDLAALGEVMLRFDPGEGRVSTSRQFSVCEGGGEYNVARGLKRCFGLQTTLISALAENSVGQLIQDLIYQGGVDQSYIKWVPYDGVGREVRNGLNFTERGFGIRPPSGCSDRGHTAASQIKPGTIDWERLFVTEGCRWFHTGGIFAALSDSTPEVAKEAMIAARKAGTVVSYDLNYRPSLWKSLGGRSRASQVNRSLAPFVDVMLGNEEDFTSALGFEVANTDDQLSHLDEASYASMINEVRATFPNISVVATTLRVARTATLNDWSAICHAEGQLFRTPLRTNFEVLDRVGGGDSFASGFIYGLLSGKGYQWAVECGAAHGALAMTTPGDTSMASLPEVISAMRMGSARVER